MPSSSSSRDLSVSNARVQLSVQLPSSARGVCFVGSAVRPRVTFRQDVTYTSTSLTLIGETRATIMGKERWQAGAVMNASLGGGAMGAAGMPITSVERLTFVEIDVPLVSSTTAATEGAKQPEKRTGAHTSSSSSSSRAGSEALYEVTLPAPPDSQLLPSVTPPDFDMTTFTVAWSLKFLGIRKGILHRNDTLVLEIPVAYPSTPATLPTSVSLAKPFKFDAGSNQGMTLEAQLSVVAIAHRSPLRFTLVLSPSSPAAAHLLNSPPMKVSASLSRHPRTTPVANKNLGRSFEWAGVRISNIDMIRAKDDDWEWEGTMSLPPGECTVDSKGVSISHNINCHVISPALAQAALHISLPVFLPSSPIEPASPNYENFQTDLPAYAV